ncbi:MAG: tetratricopeptide repeat protein [Tannerellaceae bacterium]|nr:tetratricopeptide repeat protein [Tannerellaceae bacterium]
MRRVLIPLCLVIGSLTTNAQRTHRFETPERLFIEGKEMFSLKNYAGCMDKLEAYKLQAKDADLIQEADYMLVYAAYEQGRENAPELLKEYLEAYPDSRHEDEISFLIGSAHFAKEEYQKAIYWLSEADIDLLGTEQQEACSFRLAYSLLQTGEMDRSRSYFTRISQIGTTYRNPSVYYVAYIDYATGDYSNALVEFTRLKEYPDYREQSMYYITQIYFIQNKYDRVISDGEELLVAFPHSKNNSEVYRIVGNAYYHTGNQDKAIDYLSRYVSSTDTPLRGDLYILGVSYFNKGDYNKAIQSLGQTVREQDALTQNAYLFLGQSYLKIHDKNNARMAFQAAANSSYDRQVKEIATYNYALLIHETSFTGFGESVTIFENFLNDFPQSTYADKVNDYLVEVYLTTKNYQSALRSIEKIQRPSMKILEAKQDILFQLGTQSFANVHMDEAIDYFSRAISAGNYNLQARNDAYFWRGESYYRKGEYAKAVTDYQAYLNNTRQRNTDMYALAYYNLGYSYFKMQRYNEALSRFRQYLQQETNEEALSYADAHNRIGDCLFHSRQFAQAEENYTKAASLQPGAGDYAMFQKGYVLGLQKDYRGKISTMDRLIQEYPESQYVDDALFEKGRSYVLLENYPSAAEAFERLIRQFPQSSLARKAGIQLGLLYFNDNQPQKSVEAYKRVISNYPGSEEAKVAVQDLKSVYIELNDINSYANYVNSLGGSVRFEVSEQDSLTYLAAEKLFMRGDNDGARQSLVNYLQTFPQGAFGANANYYLASIAFNRKDYNEAKRLYTVVTESEDPKFLEEAVARKAEIEYLEKDYEAALESFKRLKLVAENPENREAAKLGVMRSAQLTGRSQDALIAADAILKAQKLSPEVMAEARYTRAKAYISQHQANSALPDLQELNKDTRTVYGAEATYLLSQIYYDTNEDEKAEKILMNFIENSTPHPYWLARGFILLADIYIRQGDDFQARQYLTSLQNNYQGSDDIAAMIEDRLSKLK